MHSVALFAVYNVTFIRGCAEGLQSAFVCGRASCDETRQSKYLAQRSVQFARKLLSYEVKSSATCTCQAEVKRYQN